MARKTLSDLGVAALKPRAKPYHFPDPQQPGLSIRVTPTGAKAFMVITRDPAGKQVWKKIGSAAELAIEEARAKAKIVKARIKAGLPAEEPKQEAAETFKAVAQNWIKRHVEAKGLRSKGEIERTLEKYVMPSWGDREFASLKRSDIARLLDKIEDENGARQADLTLAYLRTMSGWYAARHDDYVPPFIRGMRRKAPVKRDRILTDDELRTIWAEAEKRGQFGAILRLALLTAQRRERLASMRWEDIAAGVWNVPAEARSKGTGGALKLPTAALAIIEAQPQIEGNPYVFAGRTTGSHFDGFGKAKAAFDAALPEMPGFTIHDLRRTARSLMSRAGVRPDVGERVLGHVIAGVAGVYDRFAYDTEKADALARLAALIERILNPPAENIVILEGRR
jgi:integrase